MQDAAARLAELEREMAAARGRALPRGRARHAPAPVLGRRAARFLLARPDAAALVATRHRPDRAPPRADPRARGGARARGRGEHRGERRRGDAAPAHGRARRGARAQARAREPARAGAARSRAARSPSSRSRAARSRRRWRRGAAAGRPRRAAPVPDAPPFPALRGQLPDPVRGALLGRYGRVLAPDARTATFRKGVAWEAPVGTPVYAVAAGRVRYAGRFRGYGNVVILDHGSDHFTVSAHLDRIDVALGDPVAAGAAIGAVGETGSLEGPQLYFEIRRGGEALDPADWLARPTVGRRAASASEVVRAWANALQADARQRPKGFRTLATSDLWVRGPTHETPADSLSDHLPRRGGRVRDRDGDRERRGQRRVRGALRRSRPVHERDAARPAELRRRSRRERADPRRDARDARGARPALVVPRHRGLSRDAGGYARRVPWTRHRDHQAQGRLHRSRGADRGHARVPGRRAREGQHRRDLPHRACRRTGPSRAAAART